MKTHLTHALAVLIPVAVAAAAGVATSPAWRTFLDHHAQLAGLLALAAAATRPAWKAWQAKQAPRGF